MAVRSSKNGTRRPKNGTMARREIDGGLDDVAIFVAVARLASFAEASRRLGVPTSTVSRSVARLEERVGARLLQRTSRAVALSEEGNQLLLRAGQAVDELHAALVSTADRRAVPRGVVRVTAPSYTGATRVASILAAFAEKHPHIVVELDASNAIRDLVADGFDFAVRVGLPTEGDFVARKLWSGQFGLFATRALAASVLNGRKRATRDAIARAPFVITRASRPLAFVGPDGERIDVEPRVRFAVNEPRAAVEAARRGLGVVMAPTELVSRKTGLVRVDVDFGEPASADLYLVYPSRRLVPSRVRLAMHWLSSSGA